MRSSAIGTGPTKRRPRRAAILAPAVFAALAASLAAADATAQSGSSASASADPSASVSASTSAASAGEARNVILVVGDGLGPAHRDAIQLATVGAYDRLAMDSLPYEGMVGTNSVESDAPRPL